MTTSASSPSPQSDLAYKVFKSQMQKKVTAATLKLEKELQQMLDDVNKQLEPYQKVTDSFDNFLDS